MSVSKLSSSGSQRPRWIECHTSTPRPTSMPQYQHALAATRSEFLSHQMRDSDSALPTANSATDATSSASCPAVTSGMAFEFRKAFDKPGAKAVDTAVGDDVDRL